MRAGYAVTNDVSGRGFQFDRAGQLVKGKSAETFHPLGPWLLTADEVSDPQALHLGLSVNGELRQSSNTREMVFGVGEVLAYISRFMVLEPGDIVNTGTPPGVALGMDEPPWLNEGDVVEAFVEGCGTQRQTVRRVPPEL